MLFRFTKLLYDAIKYGKIVFYFKVNSFASTEFITFFLLIFIIADACEENSSDFSKNFVLNFKIEKKIFDPAEKKSA